jgi:hypothetical protein
VGYRREDCAGSLPAIPVTVCFYLWLSATVLAEPATWVVEKAYK